jgi:hypothetical protein
MANENHSVPIRMFLSFDTKLQARFWKIHDDMLISHVPGYLLIEISFMTVFINTKIKLS